LKKAGPGQAGREPIAAADNNEMVVTIGLNIIVGNSTMLAIGPMLSKPAKFNDFADIS
jgi:hypothetical protein